MEGGTQILKLMTVTVLVIYTLWLLGRYLKSRDPLQLHFVVGAGLCTTAYVALIPSGRYWGAFAVWLHLLLPYVFVRVLDQMHPLAKWIKTLALITGVVGTYCALAVARPEVPVGYAARLLASSLAGVILLHTTGFFLSLSTRAKGISRLRYVLAGAGSLFAIIAAVVWSLRPLLPVDVATGRFLHYTAEFLAAALFLLGVATPSWLRRLYLQGELYRFLRLGLGQTVVERAHSTFDNLCAAAENAIVGATAAVASRDASTGECFVLAVGRATSVAPPFRVCGGVVENAWNHPTGFFCRAGDDMGAGDCELCRRYGARAILAIPIRADTQVFGVLLVFQDHQSLVPEDDLQVLNLMAEQSAITLANARLLEQQLALNQQLVRSNADLERANRTKSEFLANMSHELRTPLNAIIGFSEVLSDPSMEVDRETGQQFLEHILNSGRHLLALINDILDLSKVEAGRMDLHPEELLLSEVLEGTHAVIGPLTHRKRQELNLEIDPRLTHVVHDRSRLKQILYNLLSNAVKFTPEAGRISTKATLLHHGWFEISVSDSGVGIGPDDQEKVFEEFKQVDSSYARNQQGTGLGLALVRRFCRLMGGDVSLKSELGNGSTFTVRLPVKQRLSGEVTLPPNEDGPLVLVVEDDPSAASLLSFHLARGGFRVERVTTGEQALEKARLLSPALVTLDLLLPREDGWHVLDRLRADPVTLHIPVVVVSVVDHTALSATQAEAYLVKPVDPDRLLTVVNNLIAER